MPDKRFESLNERQRTYLRLVHDLCTTSEIAFRTGDTEPSIEKNIKLANRKLGVSSRIEAARQFHDYEVRVQSLDREGPVNSYSLSTFWRLPWPVPSKAGPINVLTRQQVVAWAIILALATPIGITVAAMLILALSVLLGTHL